MLSGSYWNKLYIYVCVCLPGGAFYYETIVAYKGKNSTKHFLVGELQEVVFLFWTLISPDNVSPRSFPCTYLLILL